MNILQNDFFLMLHKSLDSVRRTLHNIWRDWDLTTELLTYSPHLKTKMNILQNYFFFTATQKLRLARRTLHNICRSWDLNSGLHTYPS